MINSSIPEDIALDTHSLIRIGVIASVDLASGRCTVTLGSGADKTETPALKFTAARIGDTRVWIPPKIGEQILLLCPAGEISAGVIVGSLSSTTNPDGGNDETVNITFKDGSKISYDPIDHILNANLPGQSTAIITATDIQISANVSINGTLTCTGEIISDDDVKTGNISLKNHVHDKVRVGTQDSGKPQ